jgi:hypothetical protein
MLVVVALVILGLGAVMDSTRRDINVTVLAL